MSPNNLYSDQTTDEPMVLTNFFAGGDARRIELSAQAACSCDCQCGCECICACLAVCSCFCWYYFNSNSLTSSNADGESQALFVGLTGPTFAEGQTPSHSGTHEPTFTASYES
jgi:hypothetical protein